MLVVIYKMSLPFFNKISVTGGYIYIQKICPRPDVGSQYVYFALFVRQLPPLEYNAELLILFASLRIPS